MISIRKAMSNRVIKNIFGIAVYRVLGVVSNFLLLGLIYRYLSNEERYGLWLTVTSILSFVYLFDFGIGNGLRNKLTEAIHKKDKILASKYVSTAYAIMLLPTVLIIIINFVVSPIFNWESILNVQHSRGSPNDSIQVFIILLITLFSVQFYLTLVYAILHSLFKSYLITLSQLIVNVMNILIVSLMYFMKINSIITLGVIYVCSSIAVLAVYTIVILKRFSDKFMLKYRFVDRALVRPIFNIGLRFLVLQFAIIVLFNTDNILISKLIGFGDVTPYQLTYKLLSIFTIALGILLTPTWSVIIEYHSNKNYQKIKEAIANVLKVFVFFCVGLFLFAWLSPIIINIWMGTYIIISSRLITFVVIFVVLHMWCNIFQSILNGLTKLNVQVVAYGISAIINIPVSVLFVVYLNMDVSGIVLGTIVSLIIPAIILPIYTYKVLKRV